MRDWGQDEMGVGVGVGVGVGMRMRIGVGTRWGCVFSLSLICPWPHRSWGSFALTLAPAQIGQPNPGSNIHGTRESLTQTHLMSRAAHLALTLSLTKQIVLTLSLAPSLTRINRTLTLVRMA